MELLLNVIVFLVIMIILEHVQVNFLFYHIACDSTCLTCNGSTSNDCTSCGGSGNRFLNGNSCDCLNGYYIDTEQYACVTCSNKC